MATIKSYTTLEQSKKLAEILPVESADMCYEVGEDLDGYITKTIYTPLMHTPYNDNYIPCWSLSALLDILPDKTCVYKKTYKDGRVKYQGIAEGIKELILKDNPIDACYELILKLDELNLL